MDAATQESENHPYRNQALAILVLALVGVTLAKHYWRSDHSRTPLTVTAMKPGVTFSVDLNKASVEELDLLPGLGVTLAQQIVNLREERNGFRSIEEIMQIRGIKGAKFQELKPYLYVE